MTVGKTYKTKDGRDVEVLKRHDRDNVYACLLDGYCLAWYDAQGVYQPWDRNEKDDIDMKQRTYSDGRMILILKDICRPQNRQLALSDKVAVWAVAIVDTLVVCLLCPVGVVHLIAYDGKEVAYPDLTPRQASALLDKCKEASDKLDQEEDLMKAVFEEKRKNQVDNMLKELEIDIDD